MKRDRWGQPFRAAAALLGGVAEITAKRRGEARRQPGRAGPTVVHCVLALACCVGMSAQGQPQPKPDIAGVTMDSKGGPLRKTDLMLVALATNAAGDPMPAYSAVSESDGKFEFYDIPPGRYRLLADHAGYLRTRYGAKNAWGSGVVLTLKQGVPITALEIRMPEQAVISGKVNYDGPGGSLYLMLLQQNYQDGRRQLTSVNSASAELSGEFRFNRLAPGRYYLLARPSISTDAASDEEIAWATYYPGTLDQSGAEPITVRGGQTVSVELTLKKSRVFRVSAGVFVKPEQSAPLQGTLKVDGGTVAVPRLRIILRPATPAIQSMGAQSGADGSLNFGPVLPGRYRYQFMDLPPGAYVKSAKFGDKNALTGLDLTQPAPDARLELVISYAGAHIDGVIVDEQGKPADGVACLIPDPPQPEMSWLYQNVESGEGGRFQFQGVRPGKYRVYAFEELEPGSYMDPQITAPHEAQSVVIDVEENDRKSISVKRIAVDATAAVRAR